MRWLKYLFLGFAALVALLFVFVIGVLAHFNRDLPSLDALKNYTPMLVTTLYSDDGKVIAEYSSENRKTLALNEMPRNCVNAFVAAEDNEFFSHRGVNPITMLRAAVKNTIAGHTVQGGSTITQQVAKSILLTPERSMSRKIKEVLLAFKIEKVFTKEEIINLYLNHIYLGNRAYGIEAAAQTYFGKHASELTVPEAAILAGLPKAPSRDNPVQNPKSSKQRQVYVLGRMLASGFITKAAYREAMDSPIQIKNPRELNDSATPYYSEYVRRYLIKKYGEDMLYGGGLKVYTTMNYADQIAAQDALKVGLIALDKRAGMRQPAHTLAGQNAVEEFLRKQHIEIIEKFYDYKVLTTHGELSNPVDLNQPTPLELGKNYQAVLVEKLPGGRRGGGLLVVRVGNRTGTIKSDDYKWAGQANPEEIYKEKAIRNPYTQLKLGDVITVQPRSLHPNSRDEFFLEQEPIVQGSLLSYRLPDGALLAMVGGYDFNVTKSEFNRATQAVRQPGSTFKPFVYATALDNGLTPSTIIVDSPIVYKDTDEKTNLEKIWRPDNFGEKFYGDTTLRNALTFSRNIPTIKLLQYLKVQTVIDYARHLGITSKLNADLSLALGSSGMPLEELMHGWGAFAHEGNKLHTYFIKKVVDRTGKVLEEYQEAPVENLIPATTAFLLTSILKNVVQIGTATAVLPLGRPVAGKTGTTNDFKDALFLGYIPQMFTGVWVGFDENFPLGRNETGGHAAAPIWLQYMQTATANLPIKDFEPPQGIIQTEVDGETGDLPTPSTRKKVYEYFADGTAPGQVPKPGVGPNGAPVMTAASGQVNKAKVITGNPDVTPASNNAQPSNSAAPSDVNADEVMRDEL